MTSRFARLSKQMVALADQVCDAIRQTYKFDERTEMAEDSDEMAQIYREWFVTEWHEIEKEFSVFYQTEIRPKADADSPIFMCKDDIDFQAFFVERVARVFAAVRACSAEYQTRVYLTCATENGIQNPDKGNIKIRGELAKQFLQCLAELTLDCDRFMWNKINRMIRWIE